MERKVRPVGSRVIHHRHLAPGVHVWNHRGLLYGTFGRCHLHTRENKWRVVVNCHPDVHILIGADNVVVPDVVEKHGRIRKRDSAGRDNTGVEPGNVKREAFLCDEMRRREQRCGPSGQGDRGTEDTVACPAVTVGTVIQQWNDSNGGSVAVQNIHADRVERVLPVVGSNVNLCIGDGGKCYGRLHDGDFRKAEQVIIHCLREDID